ncbi:xylulose kinase [Achlya hypogyna]|uniref:Xylulose kinase n=1 Tax=Achlya hypogyna TaxID=1202772 RepID=A0A1V9ZUG0_ACHHY|nr:xylulose kinase [Achlya hypogyna]
MSGSKPLYVGLDCSTQSMTGVVIAALDAASSKPFEVVASVTFQLDARLPHYGTIKGVLVDGAHVLVPSLMLVESLDEILADLSRAVVCAGYSMADIVAVSGSAQQHTSAFWSATALDLPSDPALPLAAHLAQAFAWPHGRSWMDATTTAECRALEAAVGGAQRLADTTGSRGYERFTGVQLLSLKAALAPVVRMSLASSLLTSLFLGAYAPIDASDGSGMNLMDLATRAWAPDVLAALEALGLPAATLLRLLGPAPIASHAVLGRVAPYFVARHGLSPQCRVVPFSGDNPCTLAGMGLAAAGDVGISLGTSGCLFVVAAPEAIRPSAEEGHVLTNPVDPATLMGMLCFKNGSLARENVRDRRANGSWSDFSALMAARPPGNDGVMGFFYLQPEITPVVPTEAPTARLSGIHGFDADDRPIDLLQSSAAVEVRAIVEWQCLAMHVHLQQLYQGPVSRLILAGGAAVNPSLLETLANVFNAPVFVEDNRVNTAALGGAFRAQHGVACDDARTYVPFEPHVRLELRATPKAAAHAVYAAMAARFPALEARAIAMQVQRYATP